MGYNVHIYIGACIKVELITIQDHQDIMDYEEFSMIFSGNQNDNIYYLSANIRNDHKYGYHSGGGYPEGGTVLNSSLLNQWEDNLLIDYKKEIEDLKKRFDTLEVVTAFVTGGG